eukprot:s244_g17.t1
MAEVTVAFTRTNAQECPTSLEANNCRGALICESKACACTETRPAHVSLAMLRSRCGERVLRIVVPTFMAVSAITVLVTRHAIKPYNGEYNSQIAPTQWPPEWEFPIFALLSSLALVALSVLLPTKPRKFVSPLCSGIIFALGLGASGMTSQAKVLNFLDFAGYWDPSLAFVMGCGICVSFPAYLIAERGGKQPFSEGCTFENPPKKGNYVPLLIGTSLFGLGWGLVGVCPGPALAGAAPYIAVCIRSGDIQELYFTANRAFWSDAVAGDRDDRTQNGPVNMAGEDAMRPWAWTGPQPRQLLLDLAL